MVDIVPRLALHLQFLKAGPEIRPSRPVFVKGSAQMSEANAAVHDSGAGIG